MNILNDLFFRPLKAFLLSPSVSADPTIQAAHDAISNATTAVSAALPVVAANAANLAITSFAPAAIGFEPLVDQMIELTIINLFSHHSNPSAGIDNVRSAITLPATTSGIAVSSASPMVSAAPVLNG